jgi:hypothetical protein
MLRRFASIAMIAAAMSSQTKNSMPEVGVISEKRITFQLFEFVNEDLVRWH